MAFHWANDEMGVDVLENQLLEIFQSNRYTAVKVCIQGCGWNKTD